MGQSKKKYRGSSVKQSIHPNRFDCSVGTATQGTAIRVQSLIAAKRRDESLQRRPQKSTGNANGRGGTILGRQGGTAVIKERLEKKGKN